jgi:hypothetical protein
MIQLLMQLILTPILNNYILRNKNKDKGRYFRTIGFAVFLFVLFDFITFESSSAVTNTLDLASPMAFIGGNMQLTIPRAYNYFSSAAISQNPNYYAQEIIPLLLTLISATLATWRRLLNMRYTLQQGYIRKMKLFVREKIKIIEEAEINLATVDRSGNLLPRKINRNANVVKRHRAVHEAQARKKVIQKSQVTVKVSSSN